MQFDADKISPKQNYKFLSGSIIPRPIAFVTTLSVDGNTVNAAPFSFFNVVSSDPPLVSIAVQRADGVRKDTSRNAEQNGELIIHIVSESFVSDMNETAARLNSDESELDRTSLHLERVNGFATPQIEEAKIKLLASLEKSIEIHNDAGVVTADMLIARVVRYDFSSDVFDEEKEYILPEFLDVVSRLSGNDYARLGERYTIRRPD
ncbi:flavin reductase family protein [Listeria aquatica]|uniref:Flavin reductase family protein n=1 Tax=Listeria aquatica TaxID=1494960 RepID=A0A841ZM76_9LIST|nr:flavin reductase family protein [Listeria aquatica]MBC1521243.1 flavin reductase family protein [Listeria aquatica]